MSDATRKLLDDVLEAAQRIQDWCTRTYQSAIREEQPKRPDVLTASEFVRLIRKGDARDWNGCQILGDVDLKGESFAKPLLIEGATFTGNVDFSQSRFERAAGFPGCHFLKLILSDARVEGPLTLDEIVVGDENGLAPHASIIRAIVPRLEEGCRRVQRHRCAALDQKTRDRYRLIFQRRWKCRRKLKALLSKPHRSTVAELNNLHIAGCLSIMNATIVGGLSCDHAEIEDDMRIDGTRIYGNLSIRHTSLSEFRTDWRELSRNAGEGDERSKSSPCQIDGKLDFTSATINGDLRLIGITINGQLSLQAANITGNLLCRSNARWRTRLRSNAWLMVVRVTGSVDFGGAQVLGDLHIANGKLDGNLSCAKSGRWFCSFRGDVNLIGASIQNDVTFTGAHLKENLFLQNASIAGALFLNATPHLIQNARCVIEKRAWLLGVSVAADIDISGVRIGGDLILQNTNIGQNFSAKNMGGFRSEIGGDAYLNGARIRGGVDFGGALVHGELNLGGAAIEGGLRITFDFDEIHDWRMVPSVVLGRIHGQSAIIGKELILMGLTVSSTSEAQAHLPKQERGINFTGVQINGEFSLYSENLVRDILQSRKGAVWAKTLDEKTEHEITKQARRGLTTIEGNLRLARADILGDITLNGVTLKGDLDLRDANVRANINCRPIPMDPTEPSVRASVQRATFETMNMTGNMNLTGLTITGDPSQGIPGDLILQDSRIRGRLELCPVDFDAKLKDDAGYAAGSSIIGDLRLDAAEISHLILSGHNFENQGHGGEDAKTKKNRKARVVLERATVGRLQIVEPLPGTLDLSNLRVNRLDRLEDPLIYKSMLENSYPFKKSNYLTIEHALRNAGLDEQADEVHVLMRHRDRRPLRNFGRWSLDVFLDLSIRYGTTSSRLVYVMLLWFVISVWIFSSPSRVEYKVPPPLEETLPVQLHHPTNWSVSHAAVFAAQLHVPIISLGIDQEVQPSGLMLKAYAIAVVAANWVMWPLLIASASGFIRKRDEKGSRS